jgi:hypothetical protein
VFETRAKKFPLPALLIYDGVSPAVIEEPPALEGPLDDVNPVEGAHHLEQDKEAVGAQELADIPGRDAQ